MSFKKPRSDSKLLNLPEEQQAQLAEWLRSGMSYLSARALVKKEFGVSCSTSAFTSFFQEVCVPEMLRHRAQSAGAAKEIAEEVKRTPGRFDAATVDAIQQKAFEILNCPGAKAADVSFIVSLALKSRDQELKADALELQRSKFQFSAAEACLKHLPSLRQIANNSKLDERTKIDAIRRQLFGELPQEKPISAA